MNYICHSYNLKLLTMKKILLGILLLAVTLSFKIENAPMTPENGKLSGAVTYNDTYESNKPDAGCEVYIIAKADVKKTQCSDLAQVIGGYMISKSIYSQSVFNTIDPVRIKQAQDYFDTASYSTYRYINGFKKLPHLVKVTTNEKGYYTSDLKPGKYYVLFISHNVNSNNIAESKGNIDLKVVDIKSNGESVLDAVFKRHENLMMMFLAGRYLLGC
jgi:hypothetical protein